MSSGLTNQTEESNMEYLKTILENNVDSEEYKQAAAVLGNLINCLNTEFILSILKINEYPVHDEYQKLLSYISTELFEGWKKCPKCSSYPLFKLNDENKIAETMSYSTVCKCYKNPEEKFSITESRGAGAGIEGIKRAWNKYCEGKFVTYHIGIDMASGRDFTEYGSEYHRYNPEESSFFKRSDIEKVINNSHNLELEKEIKNIELDGIPKEYRKPLSEDQWKREFEVLYPDPPPF